MLLYFPFESILDDWLQLVEDLESIRTSSVLTLEYDFNFLFNLSETILRRISNCEMLQNISLIVNGGLFFGENDVLLLFI